MTRAVTTPLPAIPTSLADLAAISVEQWQAVLNAAPATAAAWIGAAAQLGHADAQAVMGQWWLDGHGVERDPVQALQMFHRAAQQGQLMAINMTGRCHEEGWGTVPDFDKAAHWYGLAVAQGMPQAQYNLANLRASGKGVAQDHAAAVALYQRAADQGYAKAFGKLGRYFEDGLVLGQDPAAARACYERAAAGGDFRGQFNLAGLLAAEGRLAEALQWLQQVLTHAHPRYLRQAGTALQGSSHPQVQAVGREMLARAG